MGVIGKVVLAVVAIGVLYLYGKINKVPPVPTIEEKWWAPGPPQKEDATIKPFKIKVSDEVIGDLKRRLASALPFQPPLEGVNHNYGINAELLKKIIDYWKNEYDWEKRLEFLNQFAQFQTTIQGLKIHFLHVKPKNVPQGTEVVPIILLHGWPGSVREFYEVIPTLTTPQKGRNFVFEVICPSMPGYGFSDAAAKPGLATPQIAQIFNKLMKRLGFERYYVHGGDWGSIISQNLAILYPENVIAVHRNWCFINQLTHWKSYVGSYFPSLIYTEKEIESNVPFSKVFNYIMVESGYFHIQATKPDTVGVALRESPVGLAAYIIEKFIAWTNPALKDVPDGGLLKKYTYDKLLDNVMIYWITRSITTSARLYSESFSTANVALKLERIPITIPAGCNRFKYEIMMTPESMLRETHTNLIHLTDYEDGGHFAAFELPDIIASDVTDFVQKVRNLQTKKSDKEL